MQRKSSRVMLGFVYLAVTLVVAFTSDAAFVHLMHVFETGACVGKTTGVTCVLPSIEIDNTYTLMVLLVAGLAGFFGFRYRWSRSNFAPFVMFISLLLIGCTFMDLAFHLQTHNLSAIYSSTVNTFTYILIFTFFVMVLITEYDPVPFILAVGASFGLKVAVFTMLAAALPIVDGATGMLLIFVSYSFAAFGLHLMLACRLFVTARVSAE